MDEPIEMEEEMEEEIEEEIEYNDFYYYEAKKALKAYTKLAQAKRPTHGRDNLFGEGMGYKTSPGS